jgi:hypothetical protein
VRQNPEDPAIGLSGGSGLQYAICTYDPQAEDATEMLADYFGFRTESDAGSGEVSVEDIVDRRALRDCSVFSVLAAVFSSAAMEPKDKQGYWQKSLQYQLRFNSARARARIAIDNNGDGRTDEVRSGGSVRLRRD